MTQPASDAGAPEPPDIDVWLERLGGQLPPGILDELGSDERTVLLDLARIAAHQSHRSAAPITTYLVGLTVAALPRSDRLRCLHELAERLDTT